MRKEKMLQLAHIVAGIIILVHGFDNFEAGDFKSAFAYLGLAIFFMIVAGLHTWINKKFYQANVAFFLIEAATLIYCAWHYDVKGQKVFYYLLLAVGVIYIGIALLSINTHNRIRKKSRRKKRRSSRSELFDEEKRSEH